MLTLTLALTLTLTLTLGEHQLNEGVRARRRDAPGSPHLALPSFPPSSPGHGTRDGGPSRAQELDEAFATMVANAKCYNDEGSQPGRRRRGRAWHRLRRRTRPALCGCSKAGAFPREGGAEAGARDCGRSISTFRVSAATLQRAADRHACVQQQRESRGL